MVTMEEKLKALQKLDSGESQKKVAFDWGVGESTVRGWIQNRSAIEKWCANQASDIGMKRRKTMKTGTHSKVDEALFLWFQQIRAKGMPVSGALLQAQAVKFHEKIEKGSTEFTASQGWLDRWKKRYGVRQLNISGESLSGDRAAVSDFKSRLHKLIMKEDISGDQLYNCDESGLNYKMLPTKTLASKIEATAPGYKRSKERVTISACSNVTGDHKLRLTLIGK